MTSRKKYLKQQKINGKRENRKKNRRKKYLFLKHIGQYDLYRQQKAGIEIKHRTIKSCDGSGIPQEIKKEGFFKRLLKRK